MCVCVRENNKGVGVEIDISSLCALCNRHSSF